ncbi:MAG TPA: fumarate hydratase [Candidatus Bathyarchaeota archaeon]|nr:fumarate hydratase [Candidatus Bathyarchaeota archaeon]
MVRTFMLETPLKEEVIRVLRVGDVVYITGVIVTARDAAHKRIVSLLSKGEALPIRICGLPIYHCGPLVVKTRCGWKVLAAGPTTSMRMEPFESEIIKRLKVRMIIGKGGMGRKTVEAMIRFGSVYCAFTGGAAVLAAERIVKVENVFWLDLGMPEALWVLKVEKFGPLIVAVDTTGNNLYENIRIVAEERCKSKP